MADHEESGGANLHRLWSAFVDALERYLDRMDQPPPAKKTGGGRLDPNRESGDKGTK